MMTHSPVAWEHVTFKDVIVKVSSADQYYKAMRFYLEVCVCVCVCVFWGGWRPSPGAHDGPPPPLLAALHGQPFSTTVSHHNHKHTHTHTRTRTRTRPPRSTPTCCPT